MNGKFFMVGERTLFQITFGNGKRISTGFGTHHYCDNQMKWDFMPVPREVTSSTAETWPDGDEAVSGYVTPDRWLVQAVKTAGGMAAVKRRIAQANLEAHCRWVVQKAAKQLRW